MWKEIAVTGGIVVVSVAVYVRRSITKKYGVHDVNNETNIKRKVVIITGGNSGLGKETAKEFYERGAIVIIASSNLELSQNVVEDMKKTKTEKVAGGELYAMKLDLGSLRSVRKFVEDFKKKWDTLHILVNNAGVFAAIRSQPDTEDGFEFNIGINYLGHFLLTNLLLDELKAASRSRIVIVSSALARFGKVDLNDFLLTNVEQEQEDQKIVTAYGTSKLLQVHFGRELGKRWTVHGINTYVVSPGWVQTNLSRYCTSITFMQKLWFMPVSLLCSRSIHQAVQTTLHCCLSPTVSSQSGLMYRDCKQYTVPRVTFEEEESSRIWDKTAELVGL